MSRPSGHASRVSGHVSDEDPVELKSKGAVDVTVLQGGPSA
jgi:hypothetical protein